jgi:uncharacterized protein YciI
VTDISDEYMREQLATTKAYTLVLLKAGPNYANEGNEQVIWEHGRRNFQLRAEGKLPIVGPVRDETDLCGVCVFDTTAEEAEQLMAGDPAVRAGILTFEVHPIRSFPGDALPG